MGTILSLSAPACQDINLVGGKGANLSILIEQGFPVPGGFVVSTHAYHDFIQNIDLTAPCENIRSSIIESAFPESLAEELMAHHETLCASHPDEFVYAVRSSATAEDLADASFAGQHDTYYYVKAEELPLKIKQCWASLWSDQAYAYRNTKGIDHANINMAVVVQLMIPSEVSGVTFTINPVSGNQEIVTEASWGMGAAIVDGRVSPDQYVVTRDDMQLKSQKVADKKFMVPAALTDSSHRLENVPAHLRKRACLSTDELEEINRWALKSEAYFESPQDLEWAFYLGQFYLLQSRPVTVSGARVDEKPDGEYVIFKPIIENFTDPLLPLSQDIFKRLFPFATLYQGRIYLPIKPFRWLLPFKISSEQTAELAYLTRDPSFKPKLSIPKLLFFVAAFYMNYLISGVLYRRTDNLPDDFMSSARAKFIEVVADETINAPDAMRTLFFKPGFFEPAGNMPFFVNLTAARYFIFLEALARLLKRWIPGLREDAASYLSAGTEGILSTDMGRRIWQLSEEARKQPDVARIISEEDPRQALEKLRNSIEAKPFLMELEDFLSVHGHRTLKEFELNSVRWEEDPTPVIAMIKNYLISDITDNHREEAVEQERKALLEEIHTSLQTLPLEAQTSWRWRTLLFLRDRARYFIRLRENSRFYHIMGFYAVRKKVLQVEQQLMKNGKLRCQDDIYYLDWDEIQQLQNNQLQWDDVEALIRERRMDHIRLTKTSPTKTLGIELPMNTEAAGDCLKGQGASPGTYEGIARVILDPGTDAEIHRGEILVAPFTDPAWTPLFLTANAAVVEVGSYLSHAGTIAREYGMPCVVDVQDCISQIRTGDRIIVDGTNGQVRFVTEAASHD